MGCSTRNFSQNKSIVLHSLDMAEEVVDLQLVFPLAAALLADPSARDEGTGGEVGRGAAAAAPHVTLAPAAYDSLMLVLSRNAHLASDFLWRRCVSLVAPEAVWCGR